MKVLIATIGTRGDVEPFLALAVGLQERGHEVAICTSAKFHGRITAYNIKAFRLDSGLLDMLDSDLGQASVASLNSLWGVARTIPKVIRQVGPIQQRMIDDCWQAMTLFRPDMVVYHPKLFSFPAFAAVTKIPVALAMLCPFQVPTSERPLFGPSLNKYANRATYRIVQWLTRHGTNHYLREWRKQNDTRGLSRSSTPSQIDSTHPIHVLHAFSEAVFPRPRDWPESATVTGYWFLSDTTKERKDWAPSESLTSFLNSGQPPVYFGFGSIKGVDPKRITEIILAAIKHTGIRAVLAHGWGGITKVNNSESICTIDEVPHEWLFPRMAAVVHHGGAGTTAAGLRAGCPTLICPIGLDQPFWGTCVEKIGAGLKTVPQRKLTAKILSESIQRVMSNESFRVAALEVAERIRRENGVENAIETIESILATHQSQEFA